MSAGGKTITLEEMMACERALKSLTNDEREILLWLYGEDRFYGVKDLSKRLRRREWNVEMTRTVMLKKLQMALEWGPLELELRELKPHQVCSDSRSDALNDERRKKESGTT